MTIPPWEEARERLRGRRGQTKHAASEAAGAQGGSLQINSGRYWHSKRDFKKFTFLFENRQTDSKTITINSQELKRITREAMFEHSLPAMRLDFTTAHEDWSLIRSRDLQDFHDHLAQLEGLLEDERRRRLEIEP